MKIIPVIDILEGKVVHAKGGKRKLYQPLKSSLFSSSEPLDIVHELEKIGFNELYIADLDSIMKNQINFDLFENLRANSEIDLMVDAGITNKRQAIQLLNRDINKIIIGTETLTHLKFLKNSVNIFGKNRIILSLDLINNKVLNKLNPTFQNGPLAFLDSIRDFGLSQIIVLDLKRVGTSRGINTILVKKILREFDLDIIVGGGIRNILELIKLEKLGIKGVLVGTALYSNLINISDLRDKHFLI